MNTNSKLLGLSLLAASMVLAGQNVRGEIVYNNSSNRQSPALFGQVTGYQMGDEVLLYTTNAGGYRFITNFVFEYFGTGFSGNEFAQLRFYANDGAAYGTNMDGSTFYAPGTVLYDSGAFSIGNTPLGSATLVFNGATLHSVNKGLIVPTNFTWTVEFFGVEAGEDAGLTLFNPPTVGGNYPDYWEKGPGAWVLNLTNGISPDALSFGAFIESKIDNAKPSVSIVSPVDKFRSFSNTLDVVGKAADGVSKIALVLYRVGDPIYGTNDFTPVTGSNSPYWMVTGIPLNPGTNYFHVKAIDGSGNQSLTAIRKFSYVVTNQLTLITNGSGSVATIPLTAPQIAHGTWLEINRDYTLSATPTVSVQPGPNFVFTNWLSSIEDGPTNIASVVRKYTFNMKTNHVLIVQFETNRFIAAMGSYYGLFFDQQTPMVSHERAGLFTLKTDSKQKFSGKLYLDGNTVGYAGLVNLDGFGISKAVIRKGKSSLLVTVQMTFDGSDSVSGSVACLSNTIYAPQGPFTSAMTGFKAVNVTNNPITNLFGLYTLAVNVPVGAGTPKGYGYGNVTVKSKDAAVVMSGNFGDYANLKSVVVPMSKNGDWPLYASAYKGDFNYVDPKTLLPKVLKEFKGSMIGWMKFTNIPPRELLDSTVHWIKTPNTNNFYENGFTNYDLTVFASAFNAPLYPKTNPVLTLTAGSMVFLDGNLTDTFSNYFLLRTNSQIIIQPPNVNTQTMAIVTKTGKIKGKFYHPNDLGNPVRVPFGAVLQDLDIALGVFKGTNASGSFILQSE